MDLLQSYCFTEEKDIYLTTCLSDRILFTYFVFLGLLRQNSTLFLKVGIILEEQYIRLKVRSLFQPLSTNSTTLNSPK